MAVFLGSALAMACGDPPLAAVTKDAAGDLGALFGDAAPKLDAPPQVGDSAAAEAANGPDAATSGDTADATSPTGADAPADVPVADATAAEVAAADVPAGPDAGLKDFALVAADPPADTTGVAANFSLKLTFSANLKPESAVKYTIAVASNGNTALPCKFAVAGNVLTITPTAPAPFASRVTVTLGTLVQSFQGVPLQETAVSFYTEPWPKLGSYAAMAEAFAPQLRQAVAGPLDYLRAGNFDGDWNLANNPANAAQSDAKAAVYWSATETRSHVYLTYFYYWPGRTGVAPGVPFDNDGAGAQVVIDRKTQLPVALQTFFKAKADEQAWLWVASESGWPTKSKFVRAFVPRDQLFEPSDAAACAQTPPANCKRRYPGYLTAGSHQSCLWADKGEPADQQCVLNDAIKSSLKLLLYAPGPLAAAAAPTLSGTPATYALLPLWDDWWPRRDQAGAAALFVDTQFAYVPPDSRPAGPKYGLGSRMVAAQDGDFGRPPWAWRWKPGTFTASYYDLPRGTPVFDPAWLLWQRLGAEQTGMPAWNAATKQGFSTDYCFNPFLGIDVRDSPECWL